MTETIRDSDSPGGNSTANDHRKTAENNAATVCRQITHPCSRHSTDQNRSRSFGNGVRRTGAGHHVAHTRLRHAANHYGGQPQNNGSTDMRHDTRYHRASVHIAYTCGGLGHATKHIPKQSFEQAGGELTASSAIVNQWLRVLLLLHPIQVARAF
jgi:hypothetical protein